MEDEKELNEIPQLYESCIIDENGEKKVIGYAYGLPWVEMALYMDDIIFDTPEEAMAYWERIYGNKKA